MSKKVLYCKKIGMTQLFLDNGRVLPVTILQADKNTVLKFKTKESDGYDSVLLGIGSKKSKHVNKPQMGHFNVLKTEPVRFLKEQRLSSEDHGLSIGDALTVDMFSIDDKVNVTGKTIGRGTCGTVKRWNFSRGLMTHGSKTHRIPGSIGAGTTPARVYKGKKMSGKKGNDNVTIKNLCVVLVDSDKGLLAVNGAVPGKPGQFLKVASAA